MTTASTERPPRVRAAPRLEQVAPGRSPARRRIDRAIGFGFLLALAAAGLGVYLLARTGWRSILDSNDGQLTEVVTNPALPGYQAVVEPTPSRFLAIVDDAGGLASVLVVGLAADDLGGTVLMIPRNTVVGDGDQVIATAWTAGGLEGTRDAVARLLGVNFDDAEVLDPARWAVLTDPVAPIDLVIPDALVAPGADGTAVVRFPAGAAALEAADVGTYLGWVNPGESAVNMLVRQELFWGAWLDAIDASDDPAAVPGEIDTGLGRFVRALAAGPQDFEPLPVEQTVDETGQELLRPLPEEVAPIVAEMLPFPLPVAPGSRPRVRVLNGVGGQELTVEVAAAAVAAGGQVTIIGNAPAFGVATSAVRYRTPDAQAAAGEMADALGVGRVELDPAPNPAIELTVLIGGDLPGTSDG